MAVLVGDWRVAVLENSSLWEGKHRAVGNTQVCGGYKPSFLLASEGGCVCAPARAQHLPREVSVSVAEPSGVPSGSGCSDSCSGRNPTVHFFMPVTCPVFVLMYSLGKFIYLNKCFSC